MPNIHQALLIGAPVEKVYEAITRQKGLSAWWTPDVTAKAELNSVSHFAFGADYFKEMKVTELKLFEKVSWHCLKGADEWIGTNISFELRRDNKESLSKLYPELKDQLNQQKEDDIMLLVFHHDDWKGYTLMFAECSYTWGRFLRSLKLLCETGKGMPWQNQHRVT